MSGLSWRARDGKLIGCAQGVDRVWVEQQANWWFWTNMEEGEWDWGVGRDTAAEAKAAAERWWSANGHLSPPVPAKAPLPPQGDGRKE